MTSIQSELPSDYGANRKEKTAIETADEVLTEPEKEIPAEYFIEAQEPDPQPTPEELYEQELAMRRRDLEYQARTSPLKKSTKTVMQQQEMELMLTQEHHQQEEVQTSIHLFYLQGLMKKKILICRKRNRNSIKIMQLMNLY